MTKMTTAQKSTSGKLLAALPLAPETQNIKPEPKGIPTL